MSNIVSLCMVNIKDIKKNECQVFIQFKNNCSIWMKWISIYGDGEVWQKRYSHSEELTKLSTICHGVEIVSVDPISAWL